jgi:arylsulfatase A-like enzyme/Tfp pilus assembly protein PilF
VGKRKGRTTERREQPASPNRRSRRAVWTILGLLLASAAIGAFLYLRPVRADIFRTEDQNVLLITLDTLRADALSAYRGGARTPNLDALAAQGVLYDFAHAHAVVTLPSHASILTGLYPFAHGVRENSGYTLAADVPTIATLLKARGFATGAFVSSFTLDSRFGLTSGFDVYDDAVASKRGPVGFAMPERRGEDVVAAARQWIAGRQGRWFAWVHLFDPHAPYKPPPPFDADYRDRPYLGEVAYMDSALAPLIDGARSSSRPTLVIATADHGEALGDHGEPTHGVFAYESTLRVPLIVAQLRPGGKGGERTSEPVRHVDILPTVLDAIGAPPAEGMAGRTLLERPGWFDGEGERTCYFEAMSSMLNRGWAPLRGVIAAREKLIELPIVELYDLEEDLSEQVNLAETRTERRRALEARLAAFNAPIASGREQESPEVVARLRALGYVSGSAAPKAKYTEADDPKRLIEIDREIHRGVDLYHRGRLREAAAVFQGLVQQRPDMSAAYAHLAFVLWEAGAAHEAIATLRDAVKRAIADLDMQLRLGIYLAEVGETREAIPLLETLAQRSNANVDVLNGLGIAYAQAGRTNEAIAMFRRVLTIDAQSALALENIGSVLLARGDLDGARAALQQAAALEPNSSRVHTGLGALAAKLGDQKMALTHWKRAIELDPTNYDALFNLATELLNAGQREAARPYVERFIRTAPPSLYAPEIARLAPIVKTR